MARLKDAVDARAAEIKTAETAAADFISAAAGFIS